MRFPITPHTFDLVKKNEEMIDEPPHRDSKRTLSGQYAAPSGPQSMTRELRRLVTDVSPGTGLRLVH